MSNSRCDNVKCGHEPQKLVVIGPLSFMLCRQCERMIAFDDKMKRYRYSIRVKESEIRVAERMIAIDYGKADQNGMNCAENILKHACCALNETEHEAAKHAMLMLGIEHQLDPNTSQLNEYITRLADVQSVGLMLAVLLEDK